MTELYSRIADLGADSIQFEVNLERMRRGIDRIWCASAVHQGDEIMATRFGRTQGEALYALVTALEKRT